MILISYYYFKRIITQSKSNKNKQNETNQQLLPDHNTHHHHWNAHLVLPVSMYVLSKINRADVHVYNIAIYGNRADAAMLAYFIDKKVGWNLGHITFNVTMI